MAGAREGNRRVRSGGRGFPASAEAVANLRRWEHCMLACSLSRPEVAPSHPLSGGDGRED